MDVTEQLALKEEKANLKKLKKVLNTELSVHVMKEEKYSREYRNFVAYDYDDVERKQILGRDLERAGENIKQIKEYLINPYHGRIDISGNGDEVETYFIGNQDIILNNKAHVISWKSEMGGLFSQAQKEKEFTTSSGNYSLLLRREISIENSFLKMINTTYDHRNVSLEGEIIDPFLLSVLRDKRRQKRLTDIIKTIQANQNEIIRLPADQNFAVQGCAGSGKTMILLHRLSVLLYNKKLNPKRTKIITPNEMFNLHINELSQELEIQYIERISIDEYYKKLISDLSNESYRFDASIMSETGLDRKLLAEFYDPKILKRIKDRYDEFWKNNCESFNNAKWRKLLKKYNLSFSKITSNKSFEIQRTLVSGN